MKYIVIKEYNIQDFIDKVQQHLDEGWNVYGNLVYADGIHIQTLVKYE